MTSINHNSTSSCWISRADAIFVNDNVREGVFDSVARARRRILRSALDASMSGLVESRKEYGCQQAMKDAIW